MKPSLRVSKRLRLVPWMVTSAVMIGPWSLCGLRADPDTVYFFSQQRVSNLLLSGSTPGNLTSDGFRIDTQNEAYSLSKTGVINLDIAGGFLDAPQTLVPFPWPAGYPSPPPENLTVLNPLVPPTDGQVLGQYNPTPWGSLGSNPGIVSLPDITIPTSARADGRGSLAGVAPGGAVDPSVLLNPQPGAGLSFDTAAEAVASGSMGFTYGLSTWAISGQFTLTQEDTVTLTFDYLSRMVGWTDSDHESALGENYVQVEIDGFLVDFLSQTISTGSPVNETENIFSPGLTLSTTSALPAGTYTITVSGLSYVELCTAPEASPRTSLAFGITLLVGLQLRRRRRRTVGEGAELVKGGNLDPKASAPCRGVCRPAPSQPAPVACGAGTLP